MNHSIFIAVLVLLVFLVCGGRFASRNSGKQLWLFFTAQHPPNHTQCRGLVHRHPDRLDGDDMCAPSTIGAPSPPPSSSPLK